MFRKIMFTLAVGLSLLGTEAKADVRLPFDSIQSYHFKDADMLLKTIEPVYHKQVLTENPWKGHWFVGVAGGASAFLGTPLGCADVFDRIKPSFSLAVGKWFTPSVGGRLMYNGLDYVDCNIDKQQYQHVHADFLWNIMGSRYGTKDFVRWDVIPYAGAGMIHNCTRGNNNFAISYGVQAQYHCSRRVAITAEVGSSLTFENFDGFGAHNRFGDNLLQATVGLSFTIGQTKWKRVVNAAPYIRQNELLIDYANSLKEKNSRYMSQHDKDRMIISELKKILEIEGLLGRYNGLFDKNGNGIAKEYPRNDYSGLNSLRARLRQLTKVGRPVEHAFVGDSLKSGNSSDLALADNLSDRDYLEMLRTGKLCIGSPVYFFFELNSDKLTEPSQLVNLDALARVAKSHNLAINVTGAADSATGNDSINDALSRSRADYITAQLKKRGIHSDAIFVVAEGGISEYSPNEANRHTKVELFIR